jgi:hypothetical protein
MDDQTKGYIDILNKQGLLPGEGVKEMKSNYFMTWKNFNGEIITERFMSMQDIEDKVYENHIDDNRIVQIFRVDKMECLMLNRTINKYNLNKNNDYYLPS